MTRRQFLSLSAAAPLLSSSSVTIPVQLIVDKQIKWRPEALHWFHSSLWAQTVEDLASCGVKLEVSFRDGEVKRPSDREPTFTGLQRHALNVVVTHRIPMKWDGGRGLCGVATLYRGYHVCMVALDRAHLHEIPFLSVNTCLHEVLHALLHDIFEPQPRRMLGQLRELRVDFEATRLWLFRGSGTVRDAANQYLARLLA